MKRILTLCPTFNRKHQLLKMLDSFYQTSTSSNQLLFLISINDPIYHQYDGILNQSNMLVFPEGTTITQMYNKALETLDYEYYHLTNDDVVYETTGWDKMLIDIQEQPGVSYAHDTIHKDKVPVFPVIHNSLAKSVGYLQLPTLNHLFGDMVWRELAIQNQSLYYHPDVYITHEHKINGMSQEEYRGEKYERDDRKAFVTWLMAGMMSDVNKIKHAKRNNLCAK